MPGTLVRARRSVLVGLVVSSAVTLSLVSAPMSGAAPSRASVHPAAADPTTSAAARSSKTARRSVPLSVWQKSPHGRVIYMRESHGNCKAVSRAGIYRGKWQMSKGLWKGYGGLKFAAFANKATCVQQDLVAYRVWISQGWRPWGG